MDKQPRILLGMTTRIKRLAGCALLCGAVSIGCLAAEKGTAFNPPAYVITTAPDTPPIAAADRQAERDYDQSQHLRERQEDKDQHDREQEKKEWIDAGTIAVLLITAFIFLLQWKDMAAAREVSQEALRVSQDGLRASQGTLQVSQSEILFRHALQAFAEAYRLIRETMDANDQLDPHKGNLGNWRMAAHLLLNAQFLRNRFMEEQHRVIYDQVERPRYAQQFGQLLQLPRSFDAERFHRAPMPGIAFGKGITSNDFLDEQALAVIYHFARSQFSDRHLWNEQEPIDDLIQGWEEAHGAYGLNQYVHELRRATGRPY